MRKTIASLFLAGSLMLAGPHVALAVANEGELDAPTQQEALVDSGEQVDEVSGQDDPQELVTDCAEASLVSNEVATPDVEERATSLSATDDQAEGEDSAQGDEAQEPVVQAQEAVELAPAQATSLHVVAAEGEGAAPKLSSSQKLDTYWKAVRYSDGSVALANYLTNTWLSAISGTDGSLTVGTTANEGSRWLVENYDEEQVFLSPVGATGLRLQLGSSAAAGTALTLAGASEALTQRFVLQVSEALTEALNDGATMDEGLLTLTTGLAGARAIDVSGGSRANSANVQTYASNGTLAQKWELAPVCNGIYTLRSAASGKALDVRGGSTTRGANVQQYAPNGTLAQLWYLIVDGNGYSIRSAKSGLALDVAGAKDANGANVQIWTPNGTAAQRFGLGPVTLLEAGKVYSFSPLHATNTCVVAQGGNAQLGTSKSVLPAYWQVTGNEAGFTITNLAGGVLQVAGSLASATNVAASKAGSLWTVRVGAGGGIVLSPVDAANLTLDVAGAGKAAGTNVRLWTANGSDAQGYVFSLHNALSEAMGLATTVDECVVRLESGVKASTAVVVKSGSTANSANVQLNAFGTSQAQKWEIIKRGSVFYTLTAANSGKVLDVKGGSASKGANVQQYAANDSLAQLWYFVKEGDGYAIRSAVSGLALDVAGGKSANGTNIQVYTANHTKAQTFKLNEIQLVSNGSHVMSTDLALPLVLAVKDGSKAQGANVLLGQSSGDASEKFTFTYVGKGLYTIKCDNAGRYLEVANGSTANSANVQLGTTSAASAQRWRLHVSKTGTVTLENADTGKYLDVAGGKKRIGTNVQQYAGNGTTAQSFTIKDGSWCFGAEVVRIARTQLGTAYSYVSSGYFPNKAFNCSGLTWWCYHQAGYDVSHNQGYYSYYTGESNKKNSTMWQTYNAGNWKTNISDLLPGDLVYFTPTGVYSRDEMKWHTGHVGIYIGNGKMIDSNVDGTKIRNVARASFVGGGLPIA